MTTNVMSEALDPVAPLTPDSRRFWEGAASGILSLPRCCTCRRLIAYPRSFCPHCGADEVEWETLSGDATVYSFVVVHKSRNRDWTERAPYVPAIVEIEPGALLTTRIVDCDPSTVSVGMPVNVTFEKRPDGVTVPNFRPRARSDAAAANGRVSADLA